MRQGSKVMKMKTEFEVKRLLLGFAALSKSQQTRLLENVNIFLFASPSHRRKLIGCWKNQLSIVADEVQDSVAGAAGSYGRGCYSEHP
jgi:hypothetical protein